MKKTIGYFLCLFVVACSNGRPTDNDVVEAVKMKFKDKLQNLSIERTNGMEISSSGGGAKEYSVVFNLNMDFNKTMADGNGMIEYIYGTGRRSFEQRFDVSKKYHYDKCSAKFFLTEKGWQCNELNLGSLSEQTGDSEKGLTETTFKHYFNTKYGFNVEYPDGLLIPQQDSDADDGKEFISRDGQMKLYVGVQFVSDIEVDTSVGSLKNIYNFLLKKYDKAIEFQQLAADKGYILLLGRKDGILYSEMYRVKDVFLCTCILTYPENKLSAYKKINEKILSSFR